MGIFFQSGETKKRAGVYQRYENAGTPAVAGASDGIVAACIRSNWGELGKVKTFTSYDDVMVEYGDGGTDGTVKLLGEVFTGGASKVHVIRVGTEGTKGKATLTDGESSPAPAVEVMAKCSGERLFKYMIRDSLSEDNTKEFVVYENGVQKEKIPFAADKKTEVDNLIAAGKKSVFFDFNKKSGYAGAGAVVALVSETEFPKGTSVAVTNADYSNAFLLLEAYTWNAIIVDTAETAVQQLLVNYNNRVYESGKMGIVVIAEPTSVEFDTRLTHAKAFNDYKVVYVGNGWYDADSNKVEGTAAAARIAGMVAAVPSNQSLTHQTISGASEPIEKMTNIQFEQTIESGMMVFSTSSSGVVWVESGITTLVNPSENDDEGWKKIKRTKVRFELMSRVTATVEPLIGRINNNSDGRATVLQAVQGVLNTMTTEEKLHAGATVELDSNYTPNGDSAWFIISADDIDSLEKIYFVYKFRYAVA